MFRRRLILALTCFLFALIHNAASAQQSPPPESRQPETPQPTSDEFENPFQKRLNDFRSTQLEDIKASEGTSRASAEREAPTEGRSSKRIARPGNRLALLFGDDVKQLMKHDPSDDKIRQLKKERCRVAFSEVSARVQEYQSGRSHVSEVLKSSGRLASALLALQPDSSTRIAILQNSVEVAKDIEKFAQMNLQMGMGTVQEAALAKYERISAEILLEEAKAKLQAGSES